MHHLYNKIIKYLKYFRIDVYSYNNNYYAEIKRKIFNRRKIYIVLKL